MSLCEHPSCNQTHDGDYGSGRFCSATCARGFSSFNKRAEINKKISISMRKYMVENPRDILFGGVKPDGRKIAKSLREYYRANPKYVIPREHLPALNREAVHRSRASKKGLLPEDTDIALIKRIYISCPTGYVVDHIKALGIGGLHTPNNLQYLPFGVNHLKNVGNIYDQSAIIKWQEIIDF